MGGEHASISLLICDDHRMLTDALAMMIGFDQDLRMVAEPVDQGGRAVALAAEFRPDVVLMDVDLRGPMDGLEATRRIKEVSPSTKVIIMSGSVSREEVLLKAVEAGASGFVDKVEAAQGLLDVVKAAAQGEALIDAESLSALLRRLTTDQEAQRDAAARVARLTAREREVLQLLAGGMRNEGIASTLHLSVRTVRTHVQNILRKLEVHSKLEAAALGVKARAVVV